MENVPHSLLWYKITVAVLLCLLIAFGVIIFKNETPNISMLQGNILEENVPQPATIEEAFREEILENKEQTGELIQYAEQTLSTAQNMQQRLESRKENMNRSK